MSNDSPMQAGIAAFKAGDKAGARAHFMQVVEADENNEQAWLWLAGAMDDPAETRICLENVLHLNPANQRAAQGLEWLRKQHPAIFVEPEPAPPPYSAPATGPTVALGEPPPAYSPQAAIGPTVALGEPAYSAPAAPAYSAPAAAAPPSSYQVPRADGASSLAGVADPQPCPRCGKPTRLAERRCRSCGFSLMQKTERAGGSKAPAVAGGVMSLLHSIGNTLGGLGLFIWILSQWTELKADMTEGLDPEQTKLFLTRFKDELDALYDRIVAPFVTFGVLLAIAGGIGVAVSIALIRRRSWAYWTHWIYNGLFFLIYVYCFLQSDRVATWLNDIAKDLSNGLAILAPNVQLAPLIRSNAGIAAAYMGVMFILLAFAYTLFTRGNARFVAMDELSGDPADHFNRGIAYRRQGMWYQSMVEWERAVELSPSDPTYRHALGLVYAQLKRPAEAQRELAEALSLDPNNMAIMQDAQKLGVSV